VAQQLVCKGPICMGRNASLTRASKKDQITNTAKLAGIQGEYVGRVGIAPISEFGVESYSNRRLSALLVRCTYSNSIHVLPQA
jgi:hypothetical protein